MASWKLVTSCLACTLFSSTALVCSGPSLSSGLLENFLMSVLKLTSVPLRITSTGAFLPGALTSSHWVGLSAPFLVGVAPGRGGVVNPQGHPASRGRRAAPDLSEAARLCLGLRPGPGPARCSGTWMARAAGPLMMERPLRLPVGDSMNINAPYFTFITFLSGFHGDGACE